MGKKDANKNKFGPTLLKKKFFFLFSPPSDLNKQK